MKAVLLSFLLLVMRVEAAEYLVKYNNAKAFNTFSTLEKQHRLQVVDQHEAGRYYKVVIDDKNVVQVLAQLLKSPNVEYAVPNFKLKAFTAPLDIQALQEQWALTKVNAEKAWSRAGNKGSRKVTVAVIDTGIDYNHTSLNKNMVSGYNFKDDNGDPMDVTGSQNPGHGTHCAGIIGATGLIDGGIMGISPEVSLMPLRFLGADGSGDLNQGIKAIDYAISKKVDVISASWGATVSREQAKLLVEAVKRADDAGIIFVVAAANDGRNNDATGVYPANAGFPNTIAVAASGPNDEKPSWSNFGTRNVHLAAPGLDIMSTLPGNKYGKLSGTSMATPLVSGLVALLKAQNPNLTGAQVRALLQSTGAQVQIETACNCRIDAGAAMDALLSEKMIVVPSAASIAPQETLQFGTLHGKAPFTYESSNVQAATIDSQGLLTATATEGDTFITVKDSEGRTAKTLAIHVKKPQTEGGGGGGAPLPPMECPLDQPMCEMLCAIMPELPWCNK